MYILYLTFSEYYCLVPCMKLERINENENEKKNDFSSELKSDEILFALCSSIFKYKWCYCWISCLQEG